MKETQKIKNISSRSMPIDGTKKVLVPGKTCNVEVTERIQYLIDNHFFEFVEEDKSGKTKKKAPTKLEGEPASEQFDSVEKTTKTNEVNE